MFLFPADFEKVVRTDIREIITNSDDTLLTDAEESAISEMKTYLRPRYKLVDMFISYTTWAAGTYATGSRVIKDGVFYRALQSTTQTPPGSHWVAGDERIPYLVLTTINIVMFHLYRRINPRKVPEHVSLAYERAVEWLKDIRKGTADLDVSLYDTAAGDANEDGIQDAGQQITYGSRDIKRNNHF